MICELDKLPKGSCHPYATGMKDSETPFIELHNVSYEAGGQRLLDSVDWRLNMGQSWAVLGPNGAGKTLLLRMIAGQLWPNAGGEVRLQSTAAMPAISNKSGREPKRRWRTSNLMASLACGGLLGCSRLVAWTISLPTKIAPATRDLNLDGSVHEHHVLPTMQV